MKKTALTLVMGFLFGIVAAQTTNADCINAIPLCTTPNFTFFAGSGNGAVNDIPNGSNISNPTNDPFPPNFGCLKSGENVPQWLLLTIGNAGTLEFVFGAANSQNPQAGCYDWAMWPYTPTTCTQIANNILPPIRCNWNATCQNGTGIASAANYTPFGGNSGDFEPPLQVSACQQFIICISNFSGVNTLVSFQSLGTASLICDPNCNPNYAICGGGTATVVPVNFADLGSPSYSMNPGALTSNTGSFVVSPGVTTTYTTYITGMNANGALQTNTAVSTVTVNPQPLATISTTQTSCTSTLSGINVNLSFNPVSPPPSYTINWLPGPPTAPATPTQTSHSGPIVPGIYTAQIVAAGGCSLVTTTTINPMPQVSSFTLNPPGPQTVSCIQPTVFIDANGNQPAYSYSWSNGATAPQSGSATAYNQFALGSWTVIGQNPVSGCYSSQVFSVSLDQTAPTSAVSPSVQNILCGPGVVATCTGTAVNPTLNVTHSWYAPNIAAPVQGGGAYSIFNPPIGTSTYVLTNNVNGCTTTKTVLVASSLGYPNYNVTSIRNFTLGCATRSFVDVHIENPNTDPTGGTMSFTLLPPGFSNPSYTFNTNPDFTLTVPGNYTMIVRDDFNNCETRVTVPIVQDIAPPALLASALTRTLTCRTPSVILEGSSTSTVPVNYQWTFQNGSNPNVVPSSTIPVAINNNTALTGTVVNVYTLTVMNTINECKSNTVVPMYQNIRPPKPKINGAGGIDCKTNFQTLINGSSLDAAPAFVPLQGTQVTRWEGPTPQEPKDSVASYVAQTVGIYTMSVMDRNNGCVTYTTAPVADNRVYPVLSTQSVVALDCGATGVNLSVTAFGLKPSDVTANWTVPAPTPNIKNPTTLTLTTDGVGDYRLTVTTNSNGCTSRAYVTVTNGSLTGNIAADQESGYAPLTVTFTNQSSSTSTVTGTQSVTTVWSYGNGTTRTTTTNISTSATYLQPGTYTVTAFTSKGSCRDTVYRVITVDIPSKLEIPNVFTPNGDNSNDVFFIKTANLAEISILIYDRWGNKVYELTTDKGNIAWDGKNMMGKEAPDGTYFYIITATGKDGLSYDKKGNISLFR